MSPGNFSFLGFIFSYSIIHLLRTCCNLARLTTLSELIHGLRDQNDLLQLLEAVYSKRNETSIYLSGKNTTEKKRVAEI